MASLRTCKPATLKTPAATEIGNQRRMQKAANHCDMRLGIVGNFVIRQLTGNQLPGKMAMTTKHPLTTRDALFLSPCHRRICVGFQFFGVGLYVLFHV